MRAQVMNPVDTTADAEPSPFAGMLDVGCTIDVIVGTGALSVRDLVNLRVNSIVHLTQPVGDHLSLLVNGVAVALVEVVIVDDTTGLRIVEMLDGDDVAEAPE